MEAETMGRVAVAARIANWEDVKRSEDGAIGPEAVQQVEVSDASVDTGATYLALPKRFIEQLGLRPTRTKAAKTPLGLVTAQIYEPVKLTVEGRDCQPEVSAIDDSCPVLIGQIPLESLDFVVDPKGRRLIGNSDHGGEQMFDQF